MKSQPVHATVLLHIPCFEVYFQFVDIRRDISAICIRGQNCLFHAKHGCRQRSYTVSFQGAACTETVPCRRYLDTDTLGIKIRCQSFEYGNNPLLEP